MQTEEVMAAGREVMQSEEVMAARWRQELEKGMVGFCVRGAQVRKYVKRFCE